LLDGVGEVKRRAEQARVRAIADLLAVKKLINFKKKKKKDF